MIPTDLRTAVERKLERLRVKETDVLKLLNKAQESEDYSQLQYRSGQASILNEVIFSMNKILSE